ncbi:MAG: response regulator [Lachnospiraceae bacterium]|nr:response regulator [Lachnospiraceae bacterium]
MEDKTRNTILIVDDYLINREVLKNIFEEQFSILEAENGEEAIKLLEENKEEIALMFLDLMMPVKSGIEVLQYMEDVHIDRIIPVIVITGEATDETDEKVYELGASDIIYKPFAPNVVMRRAKNIIELYEHRISLEEKLKQRTLELSESKKKIERFNIFLIDALSSVAEFRSFDSSEHIERVKLFTRILMLHLRKLYPEYEISLEQIEDIVSASALHDIGKMAIQDSILMKPGKLTKEEFEVMKTHTTLGCKILENFTQEENQFYQYCYDICRYHHERYDGGGYPEGLSGDNIPIWAQIVSIVDVFDSLVSKRVYKAPYASEEAARMINAGECGVFSPVVLDCFNMAKEQFFHVIKTGEFSFVDDARV